MGNLRGVERQDRVAQAAGTDAPEPSGQRRPGGGFTSWAPITAGVMSTGLFFLHFVLGLGLATVLSPSMRPAFGPGDAIVTRQESLTKIHPGQIIIYHPPGEHIALAHRIVSITWQGDRALIATKGDANPSPDKPFFIGRTGGPVVVGTVPALGRALFFVNPGRAGSRALLVGLTGLFLTTGAVRRAFRPGVGCTCRRCSASLSMTPGARYHVP